MNSAHLVRGVESFALAQEGIATVLHAHAPPYEGMMNTVGVGADAHRYRIAVTDGRPASTTLQSLQNLQADLLVLGTRGHGRILRALLGSIALEVLRGAPCDVFLLPDAALAAASR